jgi:hypothetical protein
MCRNDTNVPAVNIKGGSQMFHPFSILSVIGQKLFNRNEFQSWSVTYDYTLSYQKSSQYPKS